MAPTPAGILPLLAIGGFALYLSIPLVIKSVHTMPNVGLGFGACMIAFTSGLVAAVSPCVIVLIPLLLYRFSFQKGSGSDNSAPTSFGTKVRELAQFVAGFQISYIIFGYLISNILTSSMQNGFKMGLGSFFVLAGVLSFNDRIDPVNVPVFSSPALTGVSFAILVSVNPCTVPFLAVIITLSTTDALVSLFCFGLGLLTPAVGFVFIGSGFVRAIKKWGRVMHYVNKAMSCVLAAAGAWLMCSVDTLERGDIAACCLIFLLSTALFLKAYEVRHAGHYALIFSVAALALGVFSVVSMFWGVHEATTHELLSPQGLAESSGAEGESGVCVDRSMVPPCWACLSGLRIYSGMTAIIATAAMVVDFLARRRDGCAHALPLTVPSAVAPLPGRRSLSPLSVIGQSLSFFWPGREMSKMMDL